jgi:molybdopterin converting factor small subunit
MQSPPTITVEFFGVPRQRAGRAELTVAATTLAQVVEAIEKACPRLMGLRGMDGRLAKHYLLSVDGQRFVRDFSEELPSGSRLLLLSADAGG